MSASKKNRDGLLSRVAAELLAMTKGGKSPLDSNGLREEIIKEIEGEDEIFGKFRGLVDSLRDVIPEETRLYHAAVKTLSTTSGLSQDDVLKSADGQLAELKELAEVFKSALPDWRDELKAMESRSLEIGEEISRLRKKIGLLEAEEKEILHGMAEREKEKELAEEGIGHLLEDIAAEIVEIKEKIGESTARKAAYRPAMPQDSIKDDEGAAKRSGGDRAGLEGRESLPREASAPKDLKDKKECPVCGGQLIWYLKEKMWKCFVCAQEYTENMEAADVQEKRENAREAAPTQTRKSPPPPSPQFAIPPASSPVQKRLPRRTKACPICKKKMDWHDNEKSWQCPFCQYQRMEF